jgi:type I restriction enzyme R subunit
VLDALLVKYADEGMLNLDDANVLRIAPLSALGTPIEIIRSFGSKDEFERAVRQLQSALYQDVA